MCSTSNGESCAVPANRLRSSPRCSICWSRNRERVVSKDDLIENIWGGRIVSESSLTTRINAARTAVADSGASQQVIRTILRKGVRFVAEVREEQVRMEVGSPTLPDKPSIAVLPFANMCGDPGQEYFVDGMVEEIITALSRIRWLFVIARTSSFTYKGQAIDIKQVGRELGVRYVLEGSVRKAGQRVRITAQLIDAVSGVHLWADRFDGSLDDLFELQDTVASSVAGIIEPELQAVEAARSSIRATEDQTAYDLYLRAYAMTVSSSARIPEALRLMEQTIERDPRYAPALACPHLFRRGHRRDDRADRPRAGAQSKLRARLARERCHQDLGRPTRNGDRTCQGGTSPQSARQPRCVAQCHRRRSLLLPALRGGDSGHTAHDPAGSHLSAGLWRPCRELCSSWPPCRGTRRRPATARHRPGRDARSSPHAEPGAPRAAAFGPAHGTRRTDMRRCLPPAPG
jgi:TolB-like protein